MGRLLAISLLLGCASAHAHESDDGAVVDAPILFIPMRPQTRLVTEVRGHSPIGEGSPATADARLVFAEGEGYSDTLQIELDGLWFARCLNTGRYSIRTVESGSEGVVATRTGDASFRVSARPGSADTTVVVRGSFESDQPLACASWAGEEQRVVDFEITYAVSSREVRGLVLEGTAMCEGADRARYFWGSELSGVRYFPTDASGQKMQPSNAVSTHPVDLTLSTRDGSNLQGSGTLESVRLPMSTTVVDVRAPTGDPVSIGVADPGVLMDVDYTFSQVGFSEPDRVLSAGERVDGFDLEGVTSLIVGQVMSGTWEGHGVCSAPSHQLFEVRSETAVCPMPERRPDWRGAVAVATLERDGECRLTWSAPALNEGRGLGGVLTFTATNVDALAAWP